MIVVIGKLNVVTVTVLIGEFTIPTVTVVIGGTYCNYSDSCDRRILQ